MKEKLLCVAFCLPVGSRLLHPKRTGVHAQTRTMPTNTGAATSSAVLRTKQTYKAQFDIYAGRKEPTCVCLYCIPNLSNTGEISRILPRASGKIRKPSESPLDSRKLTRPCDTSILCTLQGTSRYVQQVSYRLLLLRMLLLLNLLQTLLRGKPRRGRSRPSGRNG